MSLLSRAARAAKVWGLLLRAVFGPQGKDQGTPGGGGGELIIVLKSEGNCELIERADGSREIRVKAPGTRAPGDPGRLPGSWRLLLTGTPPQTHTRTLFRLTLLLWTQKQP